MIKYHDFSKSKVISFDCETYDPDLTTKGPGIKRGGYILGYSLADESGFAEYYNLGHDGITIDERNKNIKYLREIMSLDIPKLGQNILYDCDWFQNFLRVKVNGKWWDTLVAEALLNENQGKYNLDFMSEKYLQLGKVKAKPEAICEIEGWKGDFRKHLWRMSYTDVRDYAIGDVVLPIKIFELQWKLMSQQDLLSLFHLEMGLFPMLIHMRDTGVLIDIKALRQAEERFTDVLFDYENELNNIAGFEVNYRASADIAKACDKFGLDYPLTEKTKKPSFTKQWLENNADTHPIFKYVTECRKIYNIVSKFLESQIRQSMVEGKIYTQFHPDKAEDYGTVTGRFSSSNPNLQNIPANDPEVGKAVRKLFLPFEGQKWGRIDYSQIEVRLMAHYAVGNRSDEICQAFNTNANIDYHQWCADQVGNITRKRAKTINFGLFYGMGIDLLCYKLNLEKDEGEAFLDMYFSRLPFIKKTIWAAKNRAESRGYVKTILGRRRRFPDRKFTYKALNAIIQGSAADIMKKSMVDSWNSGVYDVLIPLITVHDEIDVSIPDSQIGMDAFKELNEIMKKTIKLKVPLGTEKEIGKSWGDLHKV